MKQKRIATASVVTLSFLFSGCAGAKEVLQNKPDDQPRSACEARRIGQNIEVAVKLGDLATTRRSEDALIIIETQALAPQPQQLRNGETVGNSRIVTFNDLPPEAIVTSIIARGISVDDKQDIECDASSVNQSDTLQPGVLPVSGQ